MTLPVLGAASVCARCASLGPTCCEPEPGLPLAALTPGDLTRLEQATGLSRQAFSESREVDAEEAAFLQEDDPLMGALAADGRLTFLSKRDGACVFYRRESGCSLDWHARPLLCRRFPIVRQGRYLNVRPGGGCLAVEESADLPALMEALALAPEDVQQIERQAYFDMKK